MRILAVTTAGPAHAFGGSDIYAHDLAAALAAGHEVHVFARAPLSAGVLVASTTRGPVEYTVFTTAPAAGNRVRRMEAVFRELLARVRPDVVHVHHLGNMPLALPRLAAEHGAAVVLTLHDFWTMCKRTFLVDAAWRPCAGPGLVRCWRCLSRIPASLPRAGLVARTTGLDARAAVASMPLRLRRRERRMRAMLGHVDAFMSPSRHLRDRLVAHFALDPARVVVAPFGLVPFARAPLTARDPGARLRIGFVGSVNFHKGVHVLLDAFAGGLDADLVVVGPVSTGFAAARGADLRARASVRGPVGAGERHAIYEDIDVLVLPSVCHENFPLVIQEAFMAGLPVVASDLAGMAENVRHEVDGLLVPPGDAPALRRALQRLIDDPSLVDRLRKGVPPVKSMEAHAREVAEVFARACARARA